MSKTCESPNGITEWNCSYLIENNSYKTKKQKKNHYLHDHKGWQVIVEQLVGVILEVFSLESNTLWRV